MDSNDILLAAMSFMSDISVKVGPTCDSAEPRRAASVVDAIMPSIMRDPSRSTRPENRAGELLWWAPSHHWQTDCGGGQAPGCAAKRRIEHSLVALEIADVLAGHRRIALQAASRGRTATTAGLRRR